MSGELYIFSQNQIGLPIYLFLLGEARCSNKFFTSGKLFWYAFYFFFFIFIFTLCYFTVLYWFCHTSTWVHHGCTWVPNPEPPSHLPPYTIPLGYPSAPTPSILYLASNLDWRFISYVILYVSMPFSQIIPPSPLPLPQSPKNCSIHLCLFCCLAYRVIVTIFLNSIYMRVNILYWCFSFWLTSLCIIGSSFIYLIRTDSNIFF